MREMTVGKNDAGQRLDRFVSKSLPLLPPALLQKYIRIKRIKVNGGRARRDQRLQAGDVLQLYINDEFFDKPCEENMFLTLFKPSRTLSMRTRTSCCSISVPALWCMPMKRKKSIRSLTIFRRISIRSASGIPAGRMHSHRRFATVLTAIPADW